MIPSVIFLSVLLLIPLYIYYFKQKTIHKLPPGPPRLPILGNIFNAPTQYEWKQYAKWGQDFDIIYMNILGLHLVVLNTREAAYELLERRSRIYSSRPHSHMAMDLMGYAWNFALMPYNNLWRASRRLVARHFLRLPATSTSAEEDEDIPSQTQQEWYQPQIQIQTLVLLQNILRSPKLFLSHISKQIAAISLSTTFNIPISTDKDDDEYIRISNRAVDNLKFAMVPGRFLVDTFPILMYAPSWVNFKRLAKCWRSDTQLAFEKPFRDAKKRWELAVDTDTVSFVTEALNTITPDSEEEELLKAASSTLFSATIGTTSAVLNTFILAMTLYPEIQIRAQAELDAVLRESVVDTRRLIPRVEDAEKVPFCMAVIYESFRWQCVAPIALPHSTTEDDVYNGYYIPKGATVLANVWAMSNDERIYPNPSDFNPDRFLTATGSLNENLVKQMLDDIFGFGRRKCVGKPLALAILSHTCLSLLSCFHICKALDENGIIIEPKVEYESAVTSGPYPFECDFKAREGVNQFLQQKEQ